MMENTTSSSSITTRAGVLSSSSSSSSGSSNNNYSSMLYKQPSYHNYCYPYNHPLQPAVQFSGGATHPLVVGPNGAVLGALLSKEQEKKLVTKVARCKRKLARQRSQLNFSRSSTTSFDNNIYSSFSTSGRPISTAGIGFSQRNSTTGKVSVPVSGSPSSDSQNDREISVNRDLYTFCTPDNKRLRALLKKELKNSDVGSLGRIVLPKREAEEKLPTLVDREGIQIFVRDVYSNQGWSLRYKYWLNNKSRMYVVENTGDFVKQNGLEIGDSITLYEDECKNLYVSVKKGAAEKQDLLPTKTPTTTKVLLAALLSTVPARVLKKHTTTCTPTSHTSYPRSLKASHL